MTIGGLVTGALVYFPLKTHFALVLRALYKEKRDFNAVLLAQSSARSVQMHELERQQT